MAKSYDYQSAFDIIGPVMMGPSSSHTAVHNWQFSTRNIGRYS